jgi:hypothetical protein
MWMSYVMEGDRFTDLTAYFAKLNWQTAENDHDARIELIGSYVLLTANAIHSNTRNGT